MKGFPSVRAQASTASPDHQVHRDGMTYRTWPHDGCPHALSRSLLNIIYMCPNAFVMCQCRSSFMGTDLTTIVAKKNKCDEIQRIKTNKKQKSNEKQKQLEARGYFVACLRLLCGLTQLDPSPARISCLSHTLPCITTWSQQNPFYFTLLWCLGVLFYS